MSVTMKPVCFNPLLHSDAEPKYLIAVQPVPTNEVKKKCTGVVHVKQGVIACDNDLFFYLEIDKILDNSD